MGLVTRHIPEKGKAVSPVEAMAGKTKEGRFLQAVQPPPETRHPRTKLNDGPVQMRTLKRHITCSCLATLLFILFGGSALAAGINEVSASGPPAPRATTAKKLALKKHRAMLRRFVRFLGTRITLDMGDNFQSSSSPEPMAWVPGEPAPVAMTPLDRSLPLGALAGVPAVNSGTRLSINSHRVRLMFLLRW